MSKKRAPEELRDWAFSKEQIGQQLKKFYQACTTEELPPQLLGVLKKLDEERPETGGRLQATGETKD